MFRVYRLYACASDSPMTGDERLIFAASDFAGSAGLPSAPVAIGRAERGKPYMIGRGDLFVSASHSGGHCVCAASTAPIGVDVQFHAAADYGAIAARFFHPDEARYVALGGAEAFFEVWTAKEAYVKLTGEGLSGGFGGFSAVSGGRAAREINGVRLERVPFADNYTLTVCANARRVGDIIEF